jgi:hypothetical protein
MSNQEELNRGNGGTPRSAVEFTLDFEPQTEDQLIGFAKWLRAGEQGLIVNYRWVLGDRINQSNETVYGEDTIGKIAAEAGYSKSTIHKSKQFAQRYSHDQKESLLNGSFVLSWRDIALNLTIDPEDLIRAYSESSDQDEFRNAVTRLKPTRNFSARAPRKTRDVLEVENKELRNHVSDLNALNGALRQRIEELKRQLETTSVALPDFDKETEAAKALNNSRYGKTKLYQVLL